MTAASASYQASMSGLRALLDNTLSATEIADYRAEEVFARHASQEQDFLSKTSILPTFNAELCVAVTGHADS